MPRMALCGGFRIGVDMHRAEDAAVGDGERAAGEFLDGERALARLLAKSAISFSMAAKLLASASRTTGTTSPRSVETATPMS